MGQTFTVNDRELNLFLMDLDRSPDRIFFSSAKWVRRLTTFAEKKMKAYAPYRTQRSTGNLKSKITSKMEYSKNNITGTAYVPEEVKYQFAAEEGRKAEGWIDPGKNMAFPATDWKKALRGGDITKSEHDRVFVFSQVRKGKYAGRHYTAKAFTDLKNFCDNNKDRILSSIGQSLILGTNA